MTDHVGRSPEGVGTLDADGVREYAALRSALSQAQRDSERLLQFAGEAIMAVRGSHIGSDWDGGSIEESMERCGLIAKVRATEPCGEDCSCAEWDEFPQDCFRATPLGQSAIDAARSSSPVTGTEAKLK